MRREFAVALLLLLSVPFAAAQQTIPPTPPSDPTAPTQANEPLYKIGGHISAPVVIHSVMAQYTDKARREHFQGACLIGLIVDTQGKPRNIRVVRALGMGLDENALEAIRQYKFKPAMKDGKTPVPVQITIKIDFRLD
ncbi:MAG: energy transducer TonB [Terracidiphilus sp.]